MAIQQVRVLINGTWTTLTYNAGNNRYEKSIAAPAITSFNQPGGYYGVTVEATNTASTVVTKDATDGTLGTSLRLTVKETTKPTISITSPGASARVTNAQQPIVFQLRDEANGSGVKISTLKLQIDSGSILNNTSPGMSVSTVTGGYDITYTPPTGLTDGSHTVKIDISDNDGNAATQATRTYVVDTVPPVLNVTAPTANFIRNNATVAVIGNTNDITSSPVTLTIKLNGVDQGVITLDGSGNFNKSITLAEGANTIVVRSTDTAGKFSEITITGTLDTSIPQITGVTITPNPANAGQTVLVSVAVNG